METLDPAVAAARPAVDARDAEALIASAWGRTGIASELSSERDRVFLFEDADGGDRAILKIANGLDARELTDFQLAMLERVAAGETGYRTPAPIPTVTGAKSIMADVDGSAHAARLLSFVPGHPLDRVTPFDAKLQRQLGRLVATVDGALDGLDAPAERKIVWDPRTATALIRENLDAVIDAARTDAARGGGSRSALLEAVLDGFDRRVAPRVDDLPVGLIHNDGHGDNVRVEPGTPDEPATIVGLVDFGDALETWKIAGLATACAYAGFGRRDPVATFGEITRGYAAVRPLADAEADLLFDLIRLRLALSVTIAVVRKAHDPENEYLSASEAPAWRLLAALAMTSPDLARYRLRDAANLDPVPAATRVRAALRASAARAAPVLDPDPREVVTAVLDLSVETGDDGGRFDPADHSAFNRMLFDRIRDAGAEVGIGRYDEVRWWYTTPEFVAPADDVDEWRTVHLGIDLFAPPDTPVRAPLAGRVASVEDNADRLDYGPTVIIEHELEADGGPVRFRTLYGHLSPRTLEEIRPGREVDAGDVIGWLGAPPRNGDWAPHLHIQIIVDPLDHEGTFPGVAAPSQRDVWRALSPDPNLVLGIPGDLATTPVDERTLRERRARRLGPSLSLSYAHPLHIVRGRGSRLFDIDGQTFLDCVNNVAHVGHCHPRVTEAARRQLGILNTNTRYLHETILEYADELTARFPDPLSVCYFVCSGTEANELALRMARTHTGKTGAVVVDGAYHGNSSSVINLSPYKFDGPGGKGVRPWVRVVPMPDVYRGRYRLERGVDGRDPDVSEAASDRLEALGRRYAEHVGEALASLNGDDGMYGSAKPLGAAAFFCESLLGCGGQIPLPPGYLASAAEQVRAAGAVYVADEVQVGFGRVGSHFWGFEESGVVPDIVTLGKPIGNGHPLAAVVTTPEIAASFDNGMEFFSTYGGNPVSCAIGLEVLGIIDEEALRENATRVGGRLEAGLRHLMSRHEIIGDVRGRGLFLGFELVTDRETRDPAASHASRTVERMRDRGILLSTDGPDHNVIKIKPPLVFSEQDADLLVGRLDDVLSESWVAAGS